MAQVIEEFLRLMAAVSIGMALGLDRDLKAKPMGMRTLGLVSLGTATVALAVLSYAPILAFPDARSRVLQGVIQGVLTGIGFLGAGAVLRAPASLKVHGLTTAAAVWVTAALAIACAVAPWPLIAISSSLAVVLLVVLQPLEKYIIRRALARKLPPGQPGPDA
jgi:putative Mg2+ transporter-C (MgtC) family protein